MQKRCGDKCAPKKGADTQHLPKTGAVTQRLPQKHGQLYSGSQKQVKLHNDSQKHGKLCSGSHTAFSHQPPVNHTALGVGSEWLLPARNAPILRHAALRSCAIWESPVYGHSQPAALPLYAEPLSAPV